MLLYAAGTLLASMMPALATEPASVSFAGPGGVTLSGLLFSPAGSGPFPAVVALHGCSGLSGGSGRLYPRDRDWGERLAAEGLLVLMPDSFGSRGLGSQCRERVRTVRPGVERVRDTVAAKSYLQARADVKPDAVSLIGWSNGATTTLYTVREGSADLSAGPDFLRAIAFYPGCRISAKRGWRTRLPLLILIGEADDWTPAAPCHELASAAKARGEPVEIVGYPGAYHDFDAPNRPVREVHGLAYTGDGKGMAHIGTDPAAREDAIRRVMAYLAGKAPAARP